MNFPFRNDYRGIVLSNNEPLLLYANKLQTPFYLYDGGVIRHQIALLQAWFPEAQFYYSMKANPHIEVLRLLRSLGISVDISSSGELDVALRAGYSPDEMLFTGPGKTDKEIQRAVSKHVGLIAVESLDELIEIDNVSIALGQVSDALLRINVAARASELLSRAPTGASLFDRTSEEMSGHATKFGIDEEMMEAVLQWKAKYCQIRGVHVYFESQILDENQLAENFRSCVQIVERFHNITGSSDFILDWGAGFGVPYSVDQYALDLRRLRSLINDDISRFLCGGGKLFIELGRFFAAESGIFVSQVVRVKSSRGHNFVILDSGINHFLRPSISRFGHKILVLNKIGNSPTDFYSVVGPCCTPADFFANNVALPQVEKGDFIGILNAGAYGCSMSLVNFISFPPPIEIFVDGKGETKNTSINHR